jgi:hypothetical protein
VLDRPNSRFSRRRSRGSGGSREKLEPFPAPSASSA